MKTLVLVFLIGSMVSLHAEFAPVPVPNSTSPNGAFSVRLTHDRAEETEIRRVERSEVQIIANTGSQVLASFPYPAGTSADGKPPHAKITAQWNPDGTAVAISFSERFFTHLLVYQLEGTLKDPKAFIAVRLPDRPAVIQTALPHFKKFVPPWKESLRGWTGPHTVDFSSGVNAIVEPDSRIRAVYSFSVDISDTKAPVIKRMERIADND